MSEDVQSTATAEAPLRDQLARGDAAIAGARPVLRHLLVTRDHVMFSDEVRARVFGMLQHVARQLLAVGAGDVSSAVSEHDIGTEEQASFLASMLAEDSAFLAHAHALALEAQLVGTLQRRTGLDGVVSPLIQELSASSNTEQAGLAMRVLAAQARFLQQQRRMELPLGELPSDLLDKALLLMRSCAQEGDLDETGEAALRQRLADKNGRLGLMEQLVRNMGRDAVNALAIDHAGPALFLMALSLGAGIDRTLAIYSCGEDQLVRLALTLRATGLDVQQIRRQFLYLHPDIDVPAGIETTSPARASAILAEPAAELVG
jgi:hypothetical protein